jgi:hypothetical protein
MKSPRDLPGKTLLSIPCSRRGRVALVRAAERIAVMDHDQIVEEGNARLF